MLGRTHLPKFADPRGGTILPCRKAKRCIGIKDEPVLSTFVLPWNKIGSALGPLENANVQTASAVLLSYDSSILFRPSQPRAWRNHLLGSSCQLPGLIIDKIQNRFTCRALGDHSTHKIQERYPLSERGRISRVGSTPCKLPYSR
jgi:hypothetical protein